MFFVPWAFLLFVMFYGGAAIVIRELSWRWNTGWMGILFMGAAFGILQEGCATRAFFDPAWPSLGPMMNHGRWLGVNWIWSMDAILYHAIYSMAVPILFVNQLFPDAQEQTWMGKTALGTAGAAFILGLSVWLYSGKDRYQPPTSYLWASADFAALLCFAASSFKARKSNAVPTPVSWAWFSLLGFMATLGFVLQVYAIPRMGSPVITVLFLLSLLGTSVWLLTRWSRHGAWSLEQQFGLVVGILGFFALMDFFQEFNPARGNTTKGVSLVGLGSLAMLVWMNWRRKKRFF